MTARQEPTTLKQFKLKKKIIVKFKSLDKPFQVCNNNPLPTTFTIPTIQINTI